MNPPFVDPWRKARKARDIFLLAGAFGVGVACGVGGCAVVFGRDVFDRLPR